jgi:hypothetical protein
MEEKKEIILCDFEECPKHLTCAFFCVGFVKAKTLHWGAYPYEKKKGKCYKEKEIDDPIIDK